MDTTNGSIVSSPGKLLPKNKGVSSPNDKLQDKSSVESTHFSFIDEVDGLRGKANFNWLDVVCIVVSICSYVADLITDGFMAATYYHSGHNWYFGFTLAFVVIPAVTMSGLSTKWYIKDQNSQHFPPVSKVTWAFRIFCLIFFLSPVARYAICINDEKKHSNFSFYNLGMLIPFAMDYKVGGQRKGKIIQRWVSAMLVWHMRMLTQHFSGCLSVSWNLLLS